MSCGSLPCSPKGIAAFCLRISFGVSLLFMGLTHYMEMGSFSLMVGDGLGPLSPLGSVWAYILPGLMIVVGALFTVNMYKDIAAWAAGVALGSIPAGMLLKPIMSGVSIGEMMPAAINAFIWFLVFMVVVKTSSCCCGDEKCAGGCSCK